MLAEEMEALKAQIGSLSAELWPNAWTAPKRAVKRVQYLAEAEEKVGSRKLISFCDLSACVRIFSS